MVKKITKVSKKAPVKKALVKRGPGRPKGRSNKPKVFTKGRHTPQSPAKNRIRRIWMSKAPKHLIMITISHGICDAAAIFGWTGGILACDKEPEERKVISDCAGHSGGKNYFPTLNILPVGKCINSTVRECIAQYGVDSIGVVDIDLECTIKLAWDIAEPVVKRLLVNEYTRTVQLTFRNGRRDSLKRDPLKLKSLDERIEWLKQQLPQQVKITFCKAYTSDEVSGRGGPKSRQVAMCIVELQFTIPGKKNRTMEVDQEKYKRFLDWKQFQAMEEMYKKDQSITSSSCPVTPPARNSSARIRNCSNELLRGLRKSKSGQLTRKQIIALLNASTTTVDNLLSRFAKSGKIVRVNPGVYELVKEESSKE